MSLQWITNNWRLKLLALLLSVFLLGAVAFSENPITFKTVSVPVRYTDVPSNIMIINPQLSAQVTVFGLSDLASAITVDPRGQLTSGNIVVSVDASKLEHKTPGPAPVTVNAVPKVVAPGLKASRDLIPIALTVDDRDTVSLDVKVLYSNVATGWSVSNVTTNPAKVTVTGPLTQLETMGLKALVKYDASIENTSIDSPNQPISFQDAANKPVSWPPFATIPLSSYDPPVTAVHIDAKRSTATRQVTLVENVTGKPACGYRVNDISINPGFQVTVQGPADVIGKIETLQLPGIDISGATASVTQTLAIRFPEQVSAAPGQPSRVTVTIAIDQALNCTAPTPTPTPSPSPR